MATCTMSDRATGYSPTSCSLSTTCFASPPEPLFYESQNTITTELLQDTIELLIQKNDSAIKEEVLESTEFFRDQNCIQFLFGLCRHLGLAPGVKYKAAELFHRFMVGHIEELYTHVQNSLTTESPLVWKDVQERLKHQITLRAVSCVQLASKLSSHYHLVTVNRARLFLSKCGFRYAPSSVVQSEIRVLKTIKYRVHTPTPLDYVEALLGFLSKQDEGYPVKQLHGISLKMLDLFYLTREKVYSQLVNLITSRDCTEEELRGLHKNSMALAASIVTAAGLVIYESVDIKTLIVSISEAAEVNLKTVSDFAWVLLREVFTDNTDHSSMEDVLGLEPL